ARSQVCYGRGGDNDRVRRNARNLTQNQVVATSCWFESGQGHQIRWRRCVGASHGCPASGGHGRLSISRIVSTPHLLGASSYEWRTRRGSLARKPCGDVGRAWLGRSGASRNIAARTLEGARQLANQSPRPRSPPPLRPPPP